VGCTNPRVRSGARLRELKMWDLVETADSLPDSMSRPKTVAMSAG
jgi:hypothetical protein